METPSPHGLNQQNPGLRFNHHGWFRATHPDQRKHPRGKPKKARKKHRFHRHQSWFLTQPGFMVMRYIKYHYWLVLWNHGIFWLSRNSWKCHHPNWLSLHHFSGQPVHVFHVCHEENGPLGFNRFNHGRYPYRSYQTSQRSQQKSGWWFGTLFFIYWLFVTLW